MKQIRKPFSKPATAQPVLTTFGQLSKNNETSRNIFGGSSTNSNTADQGLFTQLSFTPTTTKDNSSIFGNNNIFGGNKSFFSKPNEEPTVPKVTTPADEVKKNFSFTSSLKPSVFGQNIFGQAAITTTTPLTATFGNNPIKTNEDTGTVKPFSFGEMMRENATTSLNPTTTTPVTNAFSFGKFFFVLCCLKLKKLSVKPFYF